MTPHRLSPATLVVGAALGLGLTLTTLAGGATPAAAQTLDVITLDGDIAVTINRNGETGEQTLMAGDQELLRAPTIVADLVMTDLSGNAAGIVLYADTGDPACAAAPHALTLQFGVPWVQGPLGEPCLPYAAAAYPGGAILFSTADLYRDGDA
ncbi:MAG: hypothetical protein KI785_10350, partial [Devosiaceae bacterium]|nr:hypothetical protein [Devosiaceae bacterium MH13]